MEVEMKRFLIVALVLMFASSAQASVGVGTWTSGPASFDGGTWTEHFNITPGSIGSALGAVGGTNDYSLSNALLALPGPQLTGPGTYTTSYTGGLLTLAPSGPWGGTGEFNIPFGPLTVVSVVNPDQSLVKFDLSGSSTDNMYFISAHYEVANDGYAISLTPTEHQQTGHFQGNINTVTLTHTPEPATIIIWSLLGCLGICVGWWRRRKTV
jgi:hypothetical protein